MGTATINKQATVEFEGKGLTEDQLRIEIQAIPEDARRIGDHVSGEERQKLAAKDSTTMRDLRPKHSANPATIRHAARYVVLRDLLDVLIKARS